MYGIELTNNQEFYEWVISGEQQEQQTFYDSFDYEEGFVEAFGSHDDWEDANGQVVEAQPLRTYNDLDNAMYYLYMLRYTKGLESEYHWGRRMLLSYSLIQAEDYAICSESTQELAATLVGIVNDGTIDQRDQYYYPLLDNMIEWLDQTTFY